MNIALKVTFQDNKGSIEMLLTEYPEVISDGQYLIFTDDDGKDHKVYIADMCSIEAITVDF